MAINMKINDLKHKTINFKKRKVIDYFNWNLTINGILMEFLWNLMVLCAVVTTKSTLQIMIICNFYILIAIFVERRFLRRSAANDKIFKLFFLHPFLASTIYYNTIKNKFDIG